MLGVTSRTGVDIESATAILADATTGGYPGRRAPRAMSSMPVPMAISATEVHVTVPAELPVAGSVPALTRDAGFVTTTVTVTPSTSKVTGFGAMVAPRVRRVR